MRPLHSRAVRYRGRAAHRIRYAAYMRSGEWWERRRRWAKEYRKLTGTDPVCVVCERSWQERRDDMHHRTYDQLGDEAHADLIPMCRPCHNALHALLYRLAQWRRLPRHTATDGIVSQLRSQLAARRQPKEGTGLPHRLSRGISSKIASSLDVDADR